MHYGGDWNFLAELLGLTGPNGTYFCNYCLCKIEHLNKGECHSPTPLLNYSEASPKTFQERTFDGMKSWSVKYKTDGAPKKNVKHYENCEYPPLYGQSGHVLNKTSCMPLHVTLGLGHHMLQIIENMARQEDKNIRASQGITSSTLEDLYDKRNTIGRELYDLRVVLEEKEKQEQECRGIMNERNTNMAHFLEKDGRR